MTLSVYLQELLWRRQVSASLDGTLSVTSKFADGSTWGISGLSDAASYITSGTTAPVAFSFTNSYSSIANGPTGFSVIPTLISTGASSGNAIGVTLGSIVGASANNISTYTNVRIQLTELVGYTGTISTANLVSLINPTVSGNPFSNLALINTQATTNGNGLTSGTVNNTLINLQAISATAGSGGTINNTAIAVAMATGVNAGTTTNTGLQIAGNGQSGSATNWAINSTSTAASQLSGQLTMSACALRLGNFTVATLPSASTSGVGATAFATDASTTIILGLGLAAIGSGSNKVPVYSDGTNWIIG